MNTFYHDKCIFILENVTSIEIKEFDGKFSLIMNFIGGAQRILFFDTNEECHYAFYEIRQIYKKG